MEPVIYSASLVWVFISPLGTILLTSVLGFLGLAAAFLQRKQGKGARIAMAVCGIFLLIFSCVTAVFSLASFSSGAETVKVRLNDKVIGTAGCGDGNTCTDYILEASASQVSYDFVVNARTYDLAQINTCYQVTFYKYKSLIDATPDTEMYHHVETIERIEAVDPAACP